MISAQALRVQRTLFLIIFPLNFGTKFKKMMDIKSSEKYMDQGVA